MAGAPAETKGKDGMNRYIDGDALFSEVTNSYRCATGEARKAYRNVLDMICDADNKDAEEVRHGKWVTITIPRHDPHGEKRLLCTNCEHAWRKELLTDITFGDFPKRCPECGAHMKKEKEE